MDTAQTSDLQKDINSMQQAVQGFLADVRRLHATHEQKIRALLQSIEQRKIEAIRESIHSSQN